jgi:RimJ/RimL family protein N-acetyltransferase
MLPAIRTERLAMQMARRSDVEALHAICVLPQVREFLFDDAVMTPEQVHGLVTEFQVRADRGFGLWSVFDGATGRLIGCAGILPVGAAERFYPPIANEYEPVIALHPDRWGAGLAHEALSSLTAYAFTERQLTRLFAVTDEGNARSRVLVDRLGFAQIDTVDGPRHRLCIYRLTAPRAA